MLSEMGAYAIIVAKLQDNLDGTFYLFCVMHFYRCNILTPNLITKYAERQHCGLFLFYCCGHFYNNYK